VALEIYCYSLSISNTTDYKTITVVTCLTLFGIIKEAEGKFNVYRIHISLN